MPELVVVTQLLAVVGGGTLVLAPPVLALVRRHTRRARRRHAARLDQALHAFAARAWSAESPQEVLDLAADACRDLLPLGSRVTAELVEEADGRARVDLVLPRRADEEVVRLARDVCRTATDAVERQSLSARLAAIGSTDPLTGLPNNSALLAHLERCLARGHANGTPVALLACDVVDLTALNDRWGRAAGDRGLVAMAELAAAVPHAFAARSGGDRFVVVVEDPEGETEVLDLARRLRRGVSVPGAPGAALTTAVGVVVWEPYHSTNLEVLDRDLNLALGLARTSPSGLVVYEERLRARAEAARSGAVQLERAIDAGDIVTVFQPLVDPRTLAVVGLETLARWRRDHTLVAPGQWIDLAEQTGLVLPLGLEVLRQAREALDRWGVPVSVNVATAQLEAPGFVDEVRQAWGTDRWEHLTIEVTESAALFDSLHVRAALVELSALGARIAVDDFGTGYNSLARLGQLPLDELKIDRTFVENITTEEGAAVVRAVVGLARALDLEVVAEGIERPDQLAAVQALGITTVQGFMLGRPRQDVSTQIEGARGPRPRNPRRRRYEPTLVPAVTIDQVVRSGMATDLLDGVPAPHTAAPSELRG